MNLLMVEKGSYTRTCTHTHVHTHTHTYIYTAQIFTKIMCTIISTWKNQVLKRQYFEPI